MGGYVLMALMRKYPEEVAAAMLVDTRAEGDSEEARGNRMKSIAEIEKNGTGKVIEEAIGKQLSRRTGSALKEKVRQLMEKQSGEGMASALLGMAKRRDQRRRIGRVAERSVDCGRSGGCDHAAERGGWGCRV